MPRLLPPLNPLRAFEAAGRLGSFTRAAEELNVSHSAISRHIRGLEKRLNVHLFRTLKSGVTLTEHGQTYLAQITPALDQIAFATEALTRAPEGVVTMTTESAVAQKWLVPRLPRLKAAHPEIDLRNGPEGALDLVEGEQLVGAGVPAQVSADPAQKRLPART